MLLYFSTGACLVYPEGKAAETLLAQVRLGVRVVYAREDR